ncbi:MAG TPA: hypothetical protein VET85_11810 [Stellaceae bacterium]|nr:hypothetical protein [Stellaceae bacterium]
MISVLLYGRNDQHGYNLHKRAAISINCIAEMLDASDDEIIFVDYNTPNDLPTFVEAIQDTLTEKARQRLRVLRIRPAVHERFKGKTHIPVLESVSRNAAIRRSNPRNRWVLSTNTDMIFVPRQHYRSLSEIAAGLEDAMYHLPRFDLPECLWESFDRRDPAGVIADVGKWGMRFHLNDVVYGHAFILYDGPGDFQLVLREDAFAIDGFHEAMLLGWHVDSNFAKRAGLRRGPLKSALPFLFGYHCDHTRQATALHHHIERRVTNDPERFVYAVDRAEIPEQREHWGLASEELEEISLSATASKIYVRALEACLPQGTKPYSESYYNTRGWDDLSYDPNHVLPYLCDLFSTTPRGTAISYAGCRNDSFHLFCAALGAMGFVGRIAIPDALTWLGPVPAQAGRIDRVSAADWLHTADEFVFEFGLADVGGDLAASPQPENDETRLDATRRLYQALVAQERARAASAPSPSRRVVAVNVIHNRFESMIGETLSFAYTPYSTRTRHGYVVAPDAAAPGAREPAVGLMRWLKRRRGPSGS